MELQRFGQTLIRIERLLVVKQCPASSGAFAILVFDTGHEIAISASDGKALLDKYPEKALKAA